MPVCLFCPIGNQPSFAEIGQLTKHISEAHQNVSHKSVARQPVAPVRCCICNKKFATQDALSTHQSAKKHYPPSSAFPRKSAGSEELAYQAPLPSAIVNGDATANKLDLAGYRCNECKATFDSLAQLETHRSSHRKISCSKCSSLFSSLVEWNDHFKQTHQSTQASSGQAAFVPDTVIAPHGSSSPAIIRPASSLSVINKGTIVSDTRSKGLVCDICKKVFKGQVGLQAHTAAKHPAGAKCVICHTISPSTAALEEHVNTVHSCTVCHDGILRDAKTLSDHMIEHSHPVLCRRCGTRYQTEEERKLHFAAIDNDHPACTICSLALEDEDALRAHMNSIHPIPSQPSPKPSPRRHSELGVDGCGATERRYVLRCGVCHEAYSSQTELDVHVVTVHSCPICHDGIYMDTRTLEEHLEQHRSPYACRSCGLAYAEEDRLLEHYKNSPSDIHPHCDKCQLGFENGDAYDVHVNESHPRVACDVCEGEFFDLEDLAVHYLSSRKHPKCRKCVIGFKDRFDYTDHGASAHPECHCYLCQWHFDTPDILQNHIKHFFNHPRCQDCDARFADGDAYQYHLFTVHRPRFSDHGHLDIPATVLNREEKTSRDNLLTPLLSPPALDPVWGFEGSSSLPYASFIPLPPSLSGYSSPTSQRVTESGGSSGSRSSTLSVEQRSPTESRPWNMTARLDAGKECTASPEFNHTPLSTLPAVGTPLVSGAQTIGSTDFHSPFSPRPEQPPLFSLSQGISDATVTVVENDDVNSDSSSSFTRSPPLVSPVVKLPDPGAASPSSTSSWTVSSDTDSRASAPRRRSTCSSNGINDTFSAGQTAMTDHVVPQLSLLVPSSIQLAGSTNMCNSGCPSSISPESAGISTAASMTPEYLREARAYLSLTHQVQEPASPPQSPGISSPVLSSTGLATSEQGRRREVRFEDNIMLESVWDRRSTSSDSSLDPPVILPRPGTSLRSNGASRLPRFSALKRPARKWMNGQASHASSRGHNRRPNGISSPSYHCRSCYKDHCEEPTTTTCGHLFCYECISTAVMKNARCPVCEAPMLLYCLFRIDTSA